MCRAAAAECPSCWGRGEGVGVGRPPALLRSGGRRRSGRVNQTRAAMETAYTSGRPAPQIRTDSGGLRDVCLCTEKSRLVLVFCRHVSVPVHFKRELLQMTRTGSVFIHP